MLEFKTFTKKSAQSKLREQAILTSSSVSPRSRRIVRVSSGGREYYKGSCQSGTPSSFSRLLSKRTHPGEKRAEEGEPREEEDSSVSIERIEDGER